MRGISLMKRHLSFPAQDAFQKNEDLMTAYSGSPEKVVETVFNDLSLLIGEARAARCCSFPLVHLER